MIRFGRTLESKAPEAIQEMSLDARLIASILWKRRVLRSHERWSRDRVAAFQMARLTELRRFAFERLPFYRTFHRGLENRPLADLPILTKAELMSSFDDVVTDRSVHLADVERYLAGLALSDRILVMHDGRIVGDVPQADATERTLGLMMAGVPMNEALA